MPIAQYLKRAMLSLTVMSVVFVSGAGADGVQLPDMGSPADAILDNGNVERLGAKRTRKGQGQQDGQRRSGR